MAINGAGLMLKIVICIWLKLKIWKDFAKW